MTESSDHFTTEHFAPADHHDTDAAAAAFAYCRGKAAINQWYTAQPTNSDAGQELLRKDTDWNRRCLLALAAIHQHYRLEIERFARQINDANKATNIHAFDQQARTRETLFAARRTSTLLAKRNLCLSDADLVLLIEESCHAVGYFLPFDEGVALRQAEYAGKKRPLGREATSSLKRMHGVLSDRYGASTKNLARIVKLMNDHPDVDNESTAPLPPGKPPAHAPVGSEDILADLKTYLGILPQAEIDRTVLEPDAFSLRADSPLAAQHGLICEIFSSVIGAVGYNSPDLSKSPEGVWIIDMPADERALVLLAAFERMVCALGLGGAVGYEDHRVWQSRSAACGLPGVIEKLGVKYDRTTMFDALLMISALSHTPMTWAVRILEVLEPLIETDPLTDGERYVLHRLRCVGIDQPPMGRTPLIVKRMCKLLGDPDGYWLVPGEQWADAVHTDAAQMSDALRTAWFGVFEHAATASSSKPSVKWDKAGAPLVNAIGVNAFAKRVTAWFTLVNQGRSFKVLGAYADDTRGTADTFNEGNATILRGLVWLLARHADANTPRALAELLITGIKKVPGVGPRTVKIANACVWALGECAASPDTAIQEAALGQLARLKARVTFRTTLKAIEKALDKAADAAGMSRDDLEELGIPDFSFKDGVLIETFGDARAELRVEGNKVVTQWINDKGKAVKSPPAAVKRDFKDEVKDLKQFAKDAEGILMAGRDRLDSIYLQRKSWPYADWLERYHEHGLMSTLTQRLIWQLDDGQSKTAGFWLDNGFVGHDGNAIDFIPADTSISLWHPLDADNDDIVAWREFLETRQITQPFKQAHREVYLLTDAERNTSVYSNRYAAHILKQHQFNALCGARGWRNTLRLLVDDEFPPASRTLDAWNLRAEFWVDGAGEDYGVDTNETGTFYYLATDQVRFYRADAAINTTHAGGGQYGSHAAGPGDDDVNEPLPIDQIPPIVFSEIMRDVDLFVGVASVGNDPNWADGGPEGRYRDYWQSYSFGDLGQTALTRKQTLQGLVPRLKIADKCSFDDKFLIVEGTKRTYKIHLGSGNILMKPNDQYLCIVPKAAAVSKSTDKVFLPFEGDRTMAIILSKAMMLAEDNKIKDPTILSQIKC